jgi:hypothetical protein
MVKFICGACRSTEFSPIVHVNIGADGKVIEFVDNGIFKCSNCAMRYQSAEDGSITQLESAPQAISGTPRVRSSVTAAERGKDLGNTDRKF